MKSSMIRFISLTIVMTLLIPLFPVLDVYAQTPEEEVIVLGEVKNLRKSNEKHFHCSDGSIIAVQYSEDVHYIDNTGKWQDIDNTLSYDSAAKSYKNSKNPSFDVELTEDQKISLFGMDGEITWKTTVLSMDSLISGSSVVQVPETNETDLSTRSNKVSDQQTFALDKVTSSLQYRNNADGITTSYSVSQNAVKEDVILSKNIGYVNLVTEYTSEEALTINVNDDGSLDFVNADKEIMYRVDKPYLYDAAGNVCNNVSVNTMRFKNKFVVTYCPDRAWYTDSERVYPITFDPKVSNYVGTASTLYTNSYESDGNRVTNKGTALSVGHAFGTPLAGMSTCYRTVFKPLVYPTIDLSENEIISVAQTFKIKNGTGTSSFEYYKLTSEDDPAAVSFVPQNPSLGTVTYSPSAASVTMELPVESYFDYHYGDLGYGYVAMVNEAEASTVTSTSFVNLCGVTDYTKLPSLTVTYRPKNIENRYIFIENSDKYLTLNTGGTGVQLTAEAAFPDRDFDLSNPTAQSNPLKAIWLVKTHTNGSQIIVSAYDTTKALGCDSSGNLLLISESDITASSSCFWYINYGNSNHIFCTLSGTEHPLYSNGTTVKIDTTSLTGNPDGYIWNVSDAFAIKGDIADNREYILYNPAIEKALQFSNDEGHAVSFGEFEASVEDIATRTNDDIENKIAPVTNSSTIQRVQIKAVAGTTLYYIKPYINGSFATYYLALSDEGSLIVSETPALWNFEKQANGKYIISSNGKTLGSTASQTPVASETGAYHTQWYVDCVSLSVEKCYQKQKTTCGAASSAMILRYLGVNITEEQYISGICAENPDTPSGKPPYTDHGGNRNFMNLKLWEKYLNENGNNAIDKEKHKTTYDFTPNIKVLKNNCSLEQYAYITASSLSFGYPQNSIIRTVQDSGIMDENDVMGVSEGHYIVSAGMFYDYSAKSYKVSSIDVGYRYVDATDKSIGVGFVNVMDVETLLSYCIQCTIENGDDDLSIVTHKYSLY